MRGPHDELELVLSTDSTRTSLARPERAPVGGARAPELAVDEDESRLADLRRPRRRAGASPTSTGRRRTWTTFVDATPNRSAIVPAIATRPAARPGSVRRPGRTASARRSRSMTAPASVSAPWLTTNGSATKNAAASSISSIPAALTGRTCRPYRPTIERDRADRAREDEAGVPELDDDARSGRSRASARRCSGRSAGRGSASSATSRPRRPSRPAVWSTSGPSARWSCPSIWLEERGQVGAITSMMFSSSASRAPSVRRLRTARSAASTLRPCLAASARDVGGGVVDDLAAQVSRRCPRRRRRSASRSRCSSAAPSRARPPPGRSQRRRSRARALGRDVDDHGDLGGELRLDDLAHRASRARPACPAGSRPRRSPRPRARSICSIDVVRRDRVDVVVELDASTRRAFPAAAGQARRPPPRRAEGRTPRQEQARCTLVRILSVEGRFASRRRGGLPPCGRPRHEVPRPASCSPLVLPASRVAPSRRRSCTRDVPLGGPRARLGQGAGRFNLVGLHWQGPGTVQLPDTLGRGPLERLAAARSGGARTSRTPARPSARTRRLAARQPARGSAPSDRIEYRPRGRVRGCGRTSSRARPPRSRRERSRSPAAPAIVLARPAWRRQRVDPARARRVTRPTSALRDRPPHGRRERLHGGRVGGDRARDPDLPREGERLERHRLQLPRRQVRPGVRGPLRRHRPERRRRARGGVQHRLGRRRGARRATARSPPTARRSRRWQAARLAARPRARRPAVDVARTPRAATRASRRRAGLRCARSPATATPASRPAPANALYALLGDDRAAASPRSACRSSTRRRCTARSAGTCASRARLSAPLAWTVTVTGRPRTRRGRRAAATARDRLDVGRDGRCRPARTATRSGRPDVRAGGRAGRQTAVPAVPRGRSRAALARRADDVHAERGRRRRRRRRSRTRWLRRRRDRDRDGRIGADAATLFPHRRRPASTAFVFDAGSVRRRLYRVQLDAQATGGPEGRGLGAVS